MTRLLAPVALAFAFLLGLSAPVTAQATLGLSSVGANGDTSDSNYMTGSRIVTSGAVTISSISAYVGTVASSPNNQYELAIYTDSGGFPAALVAQTANGTLQANAWNTLSISASLSASTAYWLVYNANGPNYVTDNLVYDNDAANVGVYSARTFGTWPSTFGGSTLAHQRYSIYVTTTGGATATPTPTPTSTLTPGPTATPTPTVAATSTPTSTATPVATAQPARIMPLGDSITYGQNEISYRYDLYVMLRAAGYSFDFVGSNVSNPCCNIDPNSWDADNEGHSGYSASALASGAAGWASSAQPDIVLLHAGGVNGGSASDVSNIIAALRSSRPNVKILLAEIIPMGSQSWTSYNASLVTLAASLNTTQSPVIIVDQSQWFLPADFQSDHTHPSDSGDLKLATRWFVALEQILP